jgi:hypothetical protein
VFLRNSLVNVKDQVVKMDGVLVSILAKVIIMQPK